MKSGLFVVGDNLSLQGFKDWVGPVLADCHYAVTDVMSVSEEGRSASK